MSFLQIKRTKQRGSASLLAYLFLLSAVGGIFFTYFESVLASDATVTQKAMVNDIAVRLSQVYQTLVQQQNTATIAAQPMSYLILSTTAIGSAQLLTDLGIQSVQGLSIAVSPLLNLTTGPSYRNIAIWISSGVGDSSGFDVIGKFIPDPHVSIYRVVSGALFETRAVNQLNAQLDEVTTYFQAYYFGRYMKDKESSNYFRPTNCSNPDPVPCANVATSLSSVASLKLDGHLTTDPWGGSLSFANPIPSGNADVMYLYASVPTQSNLTQILTRMVNAPTN